MKEQKPLNVRMRSGTRQGSDHIRLGINNQDSRLAEQFFVPAYRKTFCVGLVSDGCTGNPLFSHTEVGSNLMTLYAYRRIQELICSGMGVQEIPKALFSIVTEFILDLMGKVMPATIVWPYPVKIPKRETWTSQARFRYDYLAATLLGFIGDDEDIVVFSAGDGVILVNDSIEFIDQNDNPEYPAISINQAGKGFVVRSYKVADVSRLAIMSDGLKFLVKDAAFVSRLFSYESSNILGLQFLLNTSFLEHPELMKDDATAVTLERLNES